MSTLENKYLLSQYHIKSHYCKSLLKGDVKDLRQRSLKRENETHFIVQTGCKRNALNRKQVNKIKIITLIRQEKPNASQRAAQRQLSTS